MTIGNLFDEQKFEKVNTGQLAEGFQALGCHKVGTLLPAFRLSGGSNPASRDSATGIYSCSQLT